MVTHYRLKSVKEITMETVVDSTKTLQESIHERSAFVLSEMKEMVANNNNTGSAVTDASELEGVSKIWTEREGQLSAPLQEHLDHLKQESTKIEQLLKLLDQKLKNNNVNVSSSSTQVQQDVINSFSQNIDSSIAIPLCDRTIPIVGESTTENIAKSTTPNIQVLDSANITQNPDVVVGDGTVVATSLEQEQQQNLVQYAPLLGFVGAGILLIYSMFNE